MSVSASFHKRLAIFRNRHFSFFFAGQFVSRLGDGIFTLGLVWMMHVLTNSTLQMSLVLVAGVIPRIVISPVAGVFADRWPKRLTMIWSDLARGALLAVLAILAYTNTATPVVVIAISFVLSAISTVFTPAYMVMQKVIVKEDQLLQANAMQQTALNITQIAGPAIAGVMIAATGLGTTFAVDAATYFVSLGSLLAVRAVEPTRNKKPLTGLSILRDISEGTKIAMAFPQVRVLTPFMLMYNFFIIAVENLLIVQYVANVLHRGTGTVGLINAFMAVGELFGSLMLAAITNRFGRDRLLVVNMMLTALAIAAVGLTHSVPVICGLFFIGGFCMSIVSVSFFTGIQAAIPSDSLGSVFGMLGAVFNGLTPLSQLLFGAIALTFPVGGVITAVGLLACLSGAGALFNPALRKKRQLEGEDGLVAAKHG